MAVDRCVCQKRAFGELIAEAARTGESAAALSERTGCGMKCGLCRPYLKLAIVTGETSFPPMTEGAIEERILQHERSCGVRQPGIGGQSRPNSSRCS